jgi:hypothetical protein
MSKEKMKEKKATFRIFTKRVKTYKNNSLMLIALKLDKCLNELLKSIIFNILIYLFYSKFNYYLKSIAVAFNIK